MPKLTNISGRKAVKAFLKFGYTHVHTSGDHAILQKSGGSDVIDSTSQGSRSVSSKSSGKKSKYKTGKLHKSTEMISKRMLHKSAMSFGS